MQIAVIGIDLGKNICSLAGLDGSGQVVVGGACAEKMSSKSCPS